MQWEVCSGRCAVGGVQGEACSGRCAVGGMQWEVWLSKYSLLSSKVGNGRFFSKSTHNVFPDTQQTVEFQPLHVQLFPVHTHTNI